MDLEFVQFAINWGYLGVFLWFLTIDNFTPIPQEISLLTIGYLSANNFFNPVLASFSCLVAFVVVDLIYFKLSNTGHKYLNRFFENNWWISRYANKLENHMGKTLFTLCFTPRMRFISPILVGVLNLSFRKFLIYDIISLIFFIVIYIAIGNLFNQTLHQYLTEIDHATFIVFMAVLIIFSIIIIRLIIVNHGKKKQNMHGISID